jgi:hypothetical protein
VVGGEICAVCVLESDAWPFQAAYRSGANAAGFSPKFLH